MFSVTHWQKNKDWQNWAGNETATPSKKLLPSSITELQDIVCKAAKQKKRIRVTGAAHSFSGITTPDDIAISLHKIRGIISVNYHTHEVTLAGGTYLRDVHAALHEHGFSLENIGNLPDQTIAGAIATGTHGSGLALGSLSDTVTAWQWIDAQGELHEHRRHTQASASENTSSDNLTQALHVSLGLLGILVAVTLRVAPISENSDTLREERIVIGFDDALDSFLTTHEQARHAQWLIFPGAATIQQRTLQHVPPHSLSTEPTPISQKLTSLAHHTSCFFARHVRQHKYINALNNHAARHTPYSTRVGSLNHLLTESPRHRFIAIEYAIALRDYHACLSHLQQLFSSPTHPFSLPITVGTQRGETGFLSPTQGKPCVTLSFATPTHQPLAPVLHWLALTMAQWQGRPHWGKCSQMSHQMVRSYYPQLSTFLSVCEQYDPNRLFMNHYLESRLLGKT